MKDAEFTRRDFLAAACAFCGTVPFGFADERARHLDYVGVKDGPPVEQFFKTVCPLCPGGCGLQIRTVHGCAVGVRGNPWHPVNRGGLCARASAVLQELYHPDRWVRPRQRVGARGAGGWQEIDWDTALGRLVEKLDAIRRGPGPQALVALIDRDRGLTRAAWQRFLRAFGSPNRLETCPTANLGGLPAIRATHGVDQRVGYDLANATYVLSFSSQWLDVHWSATQATRGYAEFRRSRPTLRPRWVHVEPRLSLTGSKADEWIPIRPGTEGALALGIAHVIVREGLYDREFVARRSHGFDDWTDSAGTRHLGFRRLVLQDYTPARVEELTGVAAGTIFRLAREFCQHQPAVAIGYDESECGAQRCYDRIAIHCLNALVGSIDAPGGVTVFQPISVLAPDGPVDETARDALQKPRIDGVLPGRSLADSAPEQVPEGILRGQPYPIEAVFLVGANPVFNTPAGPKFVQAFERVPLVVSFANFPDDTNRHADLILPGLHGLERWDFDLTHTLRGHPVFSVARPVVTPPATLRHPYDVLRELANALGAPMAAALPWAKPLEAVQAAAREVYQVGRGAPFGPGHEEAWAQLLENRGWRAPFAATFEAFWEDLLAGGGWTDPIDYPEEWDRVFKAPARRFAFHSETLRRAWGEGSASGEDDDRRCLPHYEPLPSPQGQFPLHLYVYALPTLAQMNNPHLAWLNDISGAYMLEKWTTWVEIHPHTAEQCGVRDGEPVVVSTPRGSLTLAAKLYAGLMPGVLAVPFGFGHEVGGRWAACAGANPARVVTPVYDALSGSSFWNGTPAALRPA